MGTGTDPLIALLNASSNSGLLYHLQLFEFQNQNRTIQVSMGDIGSLPFLMPSNESLRKEQPVIIFSGEESIMKLLSERNSISEIIAVRVVPKVELELEPKVEKKTLVVDGGNMYLFSTLLFTIRNFDEFYNESATLRLLKEIKNVPWLFYNTDEISNVDKRLIPAKQYRIRLLGIPWSNKEKRQFSPKGC